MRLVSYDETDHDDVLSMNLQAFGWPITEEVVKKYLKHDERWMDIVGVYAIERGRTIGQVLPLRIPTRTREGVEVVGGIAGVTVVPDKARRGIATTLMKAAHNILRENDIRIAFLLTAESLVAYDLYLNLGYIDALSLGSAQKLVRAPRKPKDGVLRTYRKKDWRTTDEMYSRSVRRLLGFAVRQPAYLNMKIDTTPLTCKSISLADGREAQGYVVKSPGENSVVVREVACPTERSFHKIMASIEVEAAKKRIFVYYLTSRLLQRRFERRGYRLDRKTWMRMMAVPLVRSLSRKKLIELYDFDRSFSMMGLDIF
ncbi:MAG: GNAT family N-acetyltransferase [Thermoplasmata archaeon]